MNTPTKVGTSKYGNKIIDTTKKNKEVNLLKQLVKK